MGYDSKNLIGGLPGLGSSLLSMGKQDAFLSRMGNMAVAEKQLKAKDGISTGPKTDTPEETKKAGKQFEALLIQQMLASMWETVPKDGLVSGGKEEEMYRDMFNEAMGTEISEKQSLGIADAIVKDINKINSHRQKQ